MISVEIKACDYMPCCIDTFKINGSDADYDDFGYGLDTDTINAEPYGCGCQEFITDYSKVYKTMEKYDITYDEFVEIASKLEAELYVGECDLCI